VAAYFVIAWIFACVRKLLFGENFLVSFTDAVCLTVDVVLFARVVWLVVDIQG